MGYIYMIKNKKNGKIYIGQTTRPIHKRLGEHKKGKIGCRAIYNAIKKYGWENFEKDWYECPDEDLNFDEDLLVSEMRTLSPDGYNLMEGGGNIGKRSEETKQKMSEAKQGEKCVWYGEKHTEETKQKQREAQLGEKNHNFGKTPSEETRKKQSETQLGKVVSEETRQKISDANRGKIVSEDTKQKQREAQLGKTRSKESRQKQSEATKGDKHYNSKRVYQYTLDGTFIGSFGSTEEAARHLEKIDGTAIRACARGECKTAYKFKWSYIKH
jgi:group I intron endonuclease